MDLIIYNANIVTDLLGLKTENLRLSEREDPRWMQKKWKMPAVIIFYQEL